MSKAKVVTTAVAERPVESASFAVVKRAVARQFEFMKVYGLYRVDLSGASSEALLVAHATGGTGTLSPEQRRAATGDILWRTYLAAFPEGTNPVYKERAEHDCNCCKAFIRTLGGVVAIVDGHPVSIWDNCNTGTFYDVVAGVLGSLVRTAAIDNIFLHTERTVGTDKSFAQVMDSLADGLGGFTKTWDHFFVNLPNVLVVKKDAVGPRLSEAQATHDVLLRGLEEITVGALDAVLELIEQNSLYRGQEHEHAVRGFYSLKKQFDALPLFHRVAGEAKHRKDTFVWQHLKGTPVVTRIRNTSIGTLLVDLSNGVDMEDAVKKFEAMVAPANYKRPTALVTKAMIEKARVKIEELGYTSALERRYATIDDVTVNNILSVSRGTTASAAFAAPYGKGDVFAALAAKVPESVKKLDRVEEIGVETFLANVLPKATSIEVLLENRHAGNLVSLVAPVDPTAKNMFKWPNNFSWSYAGDMADSIKARVKKAGGSVVGDLCCRLAWDYADDLDFHMVEPGGRGAYEIYFGNRRTLSPCGGMLDLDANGADGPRPDPAENIFYADKRRMPEGVYELAVNNYSRNSDGKGFEVEVEFDGTTHHFAYEKVLRTGERITVAKIRYTRAGGFVVESSLPSTQASKELWGLQTQTFQKVSTVMLSPNHWNLSEDDLEVGYRGFAGVGNKHYFFMLEGCRNADRARPFFNEFLGSELDQHRKVMEMVGAKMRTEESDRQLSGLGFSSTQRASLTVRVKGAFERVVKVVF